MLPVMQSDITLKHGKFSLSTQILLTYNRFNTMYIRSIPTICMILHMSRIRIRMDDPHNVSGMLLCKNDETIQPDNVPDERKQISVQTLDLNREFGEISSN